jgi:inosine-uridine nucleoside N-ribohydrolase
MFTTHQYLMKKRSNSMKSHILKRLFLTTFVLILAATSFYNASSIAEAKNNPPPAAIPMVIDADPGVDDLAAIAYLLTRSDLVDIQGITVVAGNTTVENGANNTLILLDTAQRSDIPVVVGAAAPLVLAASHQGKFVHGPDGFWFTSYQFPPHNLAALSHDAPGFLCSKAQVGVTLLVLGPMTNVANAVQACPAQMKLYKIVWLGGSKAVDGEGNTPVSVFNPWFDPDAAEIVLESGVQMNMVSTDAARTVTIDPTIFDKIALKGNAVGKLIAPALKTYAGLFAKPTGRHGKSRVALYDPTAAVLAVHPELGTAQTSLVMVQTPDGVARGQTIIGFSLGEHVSMLASDAELSAIADDAFSNPNFDLFAALGPILFRRPDNSQTIMTVDSNKIVKEWLTGVTK